MLANIPSGFEFWGAISKEKMNFLSCGSLRASSPVWASETGLARLASLAQIGELARKRVLWSGTSQ